MSKYFSAMQVTLSFSRLASRRDSGKTHLERTSGLMYFLAFDSLCKRLHSKKLDFDPNTVEGRSNRKSIELEFTKLVLLERGHGGIRQVSELGKIDDKGKHPEKRISSNFLTVPLKKASEKAEATSYPNRPAPLFTMGQAATGLKWGLGHHEHWMDNLPKFMSEIKEPSHFIDLAVFIFRDAPIDPKCESLVDAVKHLIADRFSEKLAKFWIERIDKEKLFMKLAPATFSSKHEAFGKTSPMNDHRFQNSPKEDLIKYIGYLEGVLQANEINFIYNVKK